MITFCYTEGTYFLLTEEMGSNSHFSHPCYLTLDFTLNMKKGERNSLVLTWNTTRDFSSRYWEMDVPTTAPLSTRRQQTLSEASQTFQVDLLVWGISKKSRYWETRIQPDRLGLNSEAFQHQCIVSCYYRESSYETSRFEFDFWRASRVQRSSDLNDAHTLCPENSPGDKASTRPSVLSD